MTGQQESTSPIVKWQEILVSDAIFCDLMYKVFLMTAFLTSSYQNLAITQIRACNVVINLHLHPMKWLRSGLEDLWTLWLVLWRNTLNCNGYLEGVPGIILFTWHQLYLNCQGKVLVVLSFLFIAFLSDKACKDSLAIGCLAWFHGCRNAYWQVL